MALSDIEIPLCNSSGRDKKCKLIVNEFAGRIALTVTEDETVIYGECYFEDIKRAWDAVKRY